MHVSRASFLTSDRFSDVVHQLLSTARRSFKSPKASLLFIVLLVKNPKCFTCSACERRCYSRSKAAIPQSQNQRINGCQLWAQLNTRTLDFGCSASFHSYSSLPRQ